MSTVKTQAHITQAFKNVSTLFYQLWQSIKGFITHNIFLKLKDKNKKIISDIIAQYGINKETSYNAKLKEAKQGFVTLTEEASRFASNAEQTKRIIQKLSDKFSLDSLQIKDISSDHTEFKSLIEKPNVANAYCTLLMLTAALSTLNSYQDTFSLTLPQSRFKMHFARFHASSFPKEIILQALKDVTSMEEILMRFDQIIDEPTRIRSYLSL